jgi:hypothetical protein
MKIDRRKLLASLATTPALVPPTARGAGQDSFEALKENIEHWSIWHVQPGQPHSYIRHLATGMTLFEMKHETLAPTDIITTDYSDGWPFGEASFWPTYHASLDALRRAQAYLRKWPVHKGAVYFRYSFEKPGHPYANPIVKDAPPMAGTLEDA